MYDLLVRGHETGEQPWSGLAEGHANHWCPAADYITQQHNTWTAALLDAE
jgi:hypothetical protein